MKTRNTNAYLPKRESVENMFGYFCAGYNINTSKVN
jgi:hypothetical protein